VAVAAEEVSPMRTTGRWLAVLAGASLLMAPLASCGSDETDPATTTEAVPTAEVTMYFSRDGDDCSEVEAVTRTVESGVTLELALRDLLAGPTEAERAAGFGSWFSADTAGMLRSVEVDDGVALVSFDSSLREVISGAASSCGSANLLAQLDATVGEFDEVDRAVYALDGDVDAFYEWLQMESPEH
jgi:spore germination protein GerM